MPPGARVRNFVAFASYSKYVACMRTDTDCTCASAAVRRPKVREGRRMPLASSLHPSNHLPVLCTCTSSSRCRCSRLLRSSGLGDSRTVLGLNGFYCFPGIGLATKTTIRRLSAIASPGCVPPRKPDGFTTHHHKTLQHTRALPRAPSLTGAVHPRTLRNCRRGNGQAFGQNTGTKRR